MLTRGAQLDVGIAFVALPPAALAAEAARARSCSRAALEAGAAPAQALPRLAVARPLLAHLPPETLVICGIEISEQL